MRLGERRRHRGASWNPDGTIVFASTVVSPLYRVSSTGGAAAPFTRLDVARKEITHRWPQVLPGGKAAIFTASADNNNFERAAVQVASLSTGRTEVLVENAYFGRCPPSGRLTYISGGTIFAAPFDVDALKVTVPAFPVAQDFQTDLTNGSAQFSCSATGTAVYSTGHFSPDGKRLALERESKVWVYDLARGTLRQLTFSEPECMMPIWTPAGRRITCVHSSLAGSGAGMGWLPADGSGSLEALTQQSKVRQIPFSWSPDGRTLAFAQYSGGCCDIWMLPVTADGRPGPAKQFLTAQPGLYSPVFSPDGHWLAYT